MTIQVEQIDHVELYVPDRRAAAQWYHDVLGLNIVAEYEQWADDPNGPLMIETKSGGTKLALFEGMPTGSREMTGFHLVAFRVHSPSFLKFASLLPTLGLTNKQGQVVAPDMIADHCKAFSVYFCDPYGHQLEITTYDYEETKIGLKQVRGTTREAI